MDVPSEIESHEFILRIIRKGAPGRFMDSDGEITPVNFERRGLPTGKESGLSVFRKRWIAPQEALDVFRRGQSTSGYSVAEASAQAIRSLVLLLCEPLEDIPAHASLRCGDCDFDPDSCAAFNGNGGGDCALEDLELRRDLADLFVVCFKG